MKKLFSLLLGLIIQQTLLANTPYEKQMNEIAFEVAHLMEQRDIKKVAVWNFTPLDGHTSVISKYLVEDFSVYLTNATNTLKLFDRQHMDQILDELRLHQSGLMDPKTTQEVGTFTGVEAIITGQY